MALLLRTLLILQALFAKAVAKICGPLLTIALICGLSLQYKIGSGEASGLASPEHAFRLALDGGISLCPCSFLECTLVSLRGEA